MGALDLEGSEAPAVVLDLSPGGVRLQTDAPPRQGGEYQLHFRVHGQACSLWLQVIYCAGAGGHFQWGCRFRDLADAERESLRRSVQAASGGGETVVRPWPEVLPAAEASPGTTVLVGCTPSGRDITLLGQDCLEMGAEGVALFVTTVGGLESA